MSTLALSVSGLTKHYGGVAAIADVSLRVAPGERHGIIGPNGAGKTTFFNALTGWSRADLGEVRLFGEQIESLRPDEIVRRGLVRTFQHAQLCQTLTVRQNLELAVQAHQAISGLAIGRQQAARLREAAEGWLQRIGMQDRGSLLASGLSYGEQKQLEIAIGLASEPRVLLLDEPTAGLSGTETAHMQRLLLALPPTITLVIIEHDMDVLFAIASRVTVLDQGRLLLEGPAAEVRADPRVRDIYMGLREEADAE